MDTRCLGTLDQLFLYMQNSVLLSKSRHVGSSYFPGKEKSDAKTLGRIKTCRYNILANATSCSTKSDNMHFVESYMDCSSDHFDG
jgi:hypothetical protein